MQFQCKYFLFKEHKGYTKVLIGMTARRALSNNLIHTYINWLQMTLFLILKANVALFKFAHWAKLVGFLASEVKVGSGQVMMLYMSNVLQSTVLLRRLTR